MEFHELYCSLHSRGRGQQPSLALIPLPFVPLNSVLIALSQLPFSGVSCFTFFLWMLIVFSSVGESELQFLTWPVLVMEALSLDTGYWEEA